MKLSIPTAIVLGIFIAGWITLAALGKPIPTWMLAGGAIAGKIILSLMDSLVSGGGGGSSGGPTATAPVTPTPAKTMGTATLALGACALLLGCKAASSPTMPITPQTVARASAITAEAAWVQGANGCLELARERGDNAIRVQCEHAFVPAQAMVLELAGAVDTWGDLTKQNSVPCVVADLVTSSAQQIVLLRSLGVAVPPAFSTTVQIASLEAPLCQRPTGKVGVDLVNVVTAVLKFGPAAVDVIETAIQEFDQPSNSAQPLAARFALETAPILAQLQTPIGAGVSDGGPG